MTDEIEKPEYNHFKKDDEDLKKTHVYLTDRHLSLLYDYAKKNKLNSRDIAIRSVLDDYFK